LIRAGKIIILSIKMLEDAFRKREGDIIENTGMSLVLNMISKLWLAEDSPCAQIAGRVTFL
jgi:hypothetical protein